MSVISYLIHKKIGSNGLFHKKKTISIKSVLELVIVSQ